MEPFFKAGTIRSIYRINEVEHERPVTDKDFEGNAVLVRCVVPCGEFYDDGETVAEVWEVRFFSETHLTSRVIVGRRPIVLHE